MIGYVRGTVTHLFLDCCYIDVNGVGYRVYTPTSVQAKLQEGKEACLFTYTNVREDAIQLYGFSSLEEYDLFILLISVSGVGPKVGLGVLSGMSPEQFVGVIINGDATALTKLPGIGKKSAERLVLELKDKIQKLGVRADVSVSVVPPSIASSGVIGGAIEGLKGLGIHENEALPILESLYDGTQDEGTLIRLVLVEIGKGR